MIHITPTHRIYPNRAAAQTVLNEVLASAHTVDDDWTYRLVPMNDGIRYVIEILDEDGERLGCLP